jgi:DNA-binding YbaB/EbfC family protein
LILTRDPSRSPVAKQKPPSNPQANLMRQMQRMQQEMETAQASLAAETVEGSAGGGVVKATATGAGELRAVSIAPEVVDPGDVEMLEDLVVAAVTEALRAAHDLQAQSMGAVTGGVDLGPLGGLLG